MFTIVRRAVAVTHTGLAQGVLIAGTFLFQGTVPASPQTPNQAVQAAPPSPQQPHPLSKKAQLYTGKWVFLARSDGNLANFMPTGSAFEPLLGMRCLRGTGKADMYVDLPPGTPAGQRATVRIIRGAVDVAVTGGTEDGPSGVGLIGDAALQPLAGLATGSGDVLLAFANGTVWKLPEKGFPKVYDRFLKSCGVKPPAPAPAAGTTACLTYKTRVTLTGTVTQRVYPGPPNFESVATGDRPETVTLLKLTAPACVAADPVDPEGHSPAVARIDEIQIVPKSGGVGNGVPGQTLSLSGRLIGAQTGHHRTAVLLDDVQTAASEGAGPKVCDVAKSDQLDAKVKAAVAASAAAEKDSKNLDKCAYSLPILFAMRELRAEINKCRGRSDLEERIQASDILTPRLEAVLVNCLKAKGLQ